MGLIKSAFADGSRLDLDGLTVRLKVNARARRLSLRIDAARGEAIATAPTVRALKDAAAFARSRRGWIAERIASRPRPTSLSAGEIISVFGAPCILRPDGRRPRIVRDPEGGAHRLIGCGETLVDPGLVVRAVKREAAAVFLDRAGVHCADLGVPAPAVRVIEARSRWGSCTPPRAGSPGRIRLSWRLALAPFEVADYVVAHECAHLLEPNHGPLFWAHVHRLVGAHQPYRAWLKAEGARLHAFGASVPGA
jgi:predicted metal-dependent hydrolase